MVIYILNLRNLWFKLFILRYIGLVILIQFTKHTLIFLAVLL